jgi:cyclic pyranopterin phosphate synthase
VLVDRYGRVATDLRVSLTDRCNLRCTYCMPAEGLDWLPSPELLTDDEMVGSSGVAVSLGVARSASPAASRCCVAGSPGWSRGSPR